MQRSKSIVEFQQLMRQDAQAALRSELDRLIDNADKEDRDYFANEFNSFANLFERFLQERGPSIEWENIKPPAEGMVSTKLFWPGMKFSGDRPVQLGPDPVGFGPLSPGSDWT